MLFIFAMKPNWAIPENIHTIPRTAFRISEREGGGSRLWNSEGMGGYGAFFNQGNAVFEVLIRKIKVQSSIKLCAAYW